MPKIGWPRISGLAVKPLQDKIDEVESDIQIANIKIKMLERERDVLMKQADDLAAKADKLERGKCILHIKPDSINGQSAEEEKEVTMSTHIFTVLEGKIGRALQWVSDLQYGEMIEQTGSGLRPDYTKEYMSFQSVSQKDLDFICDIVNQVLEYKGTKLRVVNSMGELHPAHKV